ncbi:MAG: ribbon-helix-helix protein, CopG family [Caldisphaera sp.]|nr:ribbon-helix-helix protein, CopG family [Caldisphaera sp.]
MMHISVKLVLPMIGDKDMYDYRNNELRIVSFRIDTDTLFELDKISLKSRKNRSEVIRRAIEIYLAENNK